jgi:hypothetical protein
MGSELLVCELPIYRQQATCGRDAARRASTVPALVAYLLVIGGILVSLSSHAWATNLSFGVTQTGSISSPAQTNSYTFKASANDVVDFTVTTTSGTLSPALRLYNESSGTLISSASNAYCSGSTIEMKTVTLPMTGTYTLEVSDCSNTHTGDYSLYAQSTNNPSGAESLPFGQTQAGTISSAAQSNTYTFSANVNDEIDFTMVATSGSLSPKIRLYSGSSGALISSANNAYCSGSTIEMNTIQIPATGTYTVLVGDCSDTNTGDYEIYAQRTEHPVGPAKLPPGQTQMGTIGSEGRSNTYAFTGNAHEVVDFTMVKTSGSLSPKIRLYDPTGKLISSASNAYCSGSTIEDTVTLPATGTYTVLVGDCSDKLTGNYGIYRQNTKQVAGEATLLFGPSQTDLIGSAAQSNTYIFSGSKSETIDLTMVTTSGSLSPKIRLYGPTGALLSSASNAYCSGSAIEMNTVKLPANGTYTVLVGDCSDDLTGNYAIYAQSTNNPFGPAPLLWGQVQTGIIGSPALSYSYIFKGTAGNSIDLTMATTSGNLSPKIRIYNPDGTLLGSANNAYCSGSNIEMNSVSLTQEGDYTVLVGDCSDKLTGNYNLSSECFGTCPIMPAVAWASPAAITYGTALSGTQLNATANVAGTFVYSPVSGSVLTVGPHNLSVTFTPTDTPKYSTARDFVQTDGDKSSQFHFRRLFREPLNVRSGRDLQRDGSINWEHSGWNCNL